MHIFLFVILFSLALSFAQEQSDEQRSEADKRMDLLGTVHVSRVHSLNEVKGTYKSPRRAMFMSLVLPGTGQLYVGTKQSNYVRGVFYLAEEIALISGLYYHSIYKYNKQVDKYKQHANTYFDVGSYESAMNDIYNYNYDEKYANNFNRIYGYERENYCKAFYRDASNGNCSSNFGKNYQNAGGNPGSNTPIYNSSEYYRIIADEIFILGWVDVDATEIRIIGENLNEDDPKNMSLGTSEYYNQYLSMRKKASRLADKQAIFLGAIILNHIVSAVDAALTAKAHNNSLYEEKVSFLNKIHLESDFNAGENFKAGVELVYSF